MCFLYNTIMKQYYINNKSDSLLIFFTGWGCDEYEFEHLKSKSDVLILYDYTDLYLNFDFSKYNEINLLAFSAGVFVASIFKFGVKINKKIAADGNPFLFDEKYGLSKQIQDILYNITEENADEFARNFLIKTDEEYKEFHPSKRTLESCRIEFDCLKNIYQKEKENIKDIYDLVLFGENDTIFNISAQREFYKNKIKFVQNARHNLFFRIKKYEDLLYL